MNEPYPIISIICNTYNQEKYIQDCLNSLIMQQTSVQYEILVHDDASTDKTSEIIQDYTKKYPEIMKPIIQKENQYSRGGKITTNIQLPRAKGKYIAFCEGDDYWTDVNKLQIQYDFMEKNPEYSGCCHAYDMVKKDKTLIQNKKLLSSDGPVPMSCLIGNQLEAPHFATMFLRRDLLANFGSEFLGKRYNDMVIRLYCAAQAPLYYLNYNMSAYRRFTEGSWTLREGMNSKKLAEDQKNIITFLKKYDVYTEYRYNKEISECIDWREFEIAIANNDYKTAKQKGAFKNTSLKRKLYITLGCYFPNLIKKIRS